MRRIIKRLCVVLVFSMCCSCMAAAASGGTTGALQEPAAPRQAPALGRFVETDITPPQVETQGLRPVSMIPQADGAVDFFAEAPGAVGLIQFHSEDGGGTWEQESPQWAQKGAAQFGGAEALFSAVARDENGAWYAALLGRDRAFHLIKAQGQGFQELQVPAWKGRLLTDVDGITPLQGGGFGFTYSGEAAAEVVGADGRSKTVIKDRKVSGGVFTGDRYIGADSGALSFYDTGSGRCVRRLELSHGGADAALTADRDGTLYIATRSGVDRLPRDGSIYETILEGGQYSFGDTGCDVLELRREPGADVFYMLLRQKNTVRLCRYAYDSGTPVRPDTQIDVFSLEESGSVRRAVIEFQHQHPNVTIHYQVGLESPLSREDLQRALENELKNGRGPDVLILDGLDASVYEGRLADLSTLEALDGCFPNIVAAGCREGMRYAVPIRFLAPLVAGEQSEINAFGLQGNGKRISTVVREVPTGTWDFEKFISRAWLKSNAGELATESTARTIVVASADGKAQPAVFAAVNGASEKQELSRELVSLMLSDFVQKGDFREGLPVRESVFEKMAYEATALNGLTVPTDLAMLCRSLEAANGPTMVGTKDYLNEEAE